MRIHEIPKSDRPREKLIERGAGSLTDAELLAIFLRTGLKGKSAIALAAELVKEKGSLTGLSRCSAAELTGSHGIGPAKAAELVAAFELGKRLARGGEERPVLEHSEIIFSMVGPEFHGYDREVLKIVLVDTKLRLIRIENVAMGSLNETVAHPREILRPAIVHGAYGFILLHNHPSGDPTPSTADRLLTRQITSLASLMRIELLDHIICGTAEGGRAPYYSFRDAGCL